MENIDYIDEALAKEKSDMIVFDFNTPKAADFLTALANVLTYRYTSVNEDAERARRVVGASCRTRRLAYNFNADKFKDGGAIYRDYDGKLLVYAPRSRYKGIQYNCSRTNEECVKIVAKTIKQMTYNKFVYDRLVALTNEVLPEIEAKFDEMRSANNGKLVSNKGYKAEFNKMVYIDNASLEFIVGYGNIDYERSIYKYVGLNIKYTVGKNDAKRVYIKYDPFNKWYNVDLSEVLDKLDFNDEFKKAWNAKNTGPSIFNGFTIGDTYNIYCLLADKKLAIKKMDDKVKKEYISNGQGLNPLELEMFKQFNIELNEKATKLSHELADIRKGLVKTVKDVRDKAHEEMESANEKAIAEIDKTINEYNTMLEASGCSLRLSKKTPNGLLTQGSYFN